MSKRITRDDCLEEAYRLLSRPVYRDAPTRQAVAIEAQVWIELAKQLGSSGSLEVDR